MYIYRWWGCSWVFPKTLPEFLDQWTTAATFDDKDALDEEIFQLIIFTATVWLNAFYPSFSNTGLERCIKKTPH